MNPAEGKRVFDHTVDGLARVLGPKPSEAMRARLKAIGIDLEAKLPSYPLEQWRQFQRLVREELYPGLPDDQAYFQLGERFVACYFETFIGAALAPVTRLLGPRRTVHRATQTFRSANNYTETRLTERAPNDFELWMNEVGEPSFTAGLMTRVLAGTGAKEVQVSVLDTAADHCTFRIRWAP